jgi:hypothetical protein
VISKACVNRLNALILEPRFNAECGLCGWSPSRAAFGCGFLPLACAAACPGFWAGVPWWAPGSGPDQGWSGRSGGRAARVSAARRRLCVMAVMTATRIGSEMTRRQVGVRAVVPVRGHLRVAAMLAFGVDQLERRLGEHGVVPVDGEEFALADGGRLSRPRARAGDGGEMSELSASGCWRRSWEGSAHDPSRSPAAGSPRGAE